MRELTGAEIVIESLYAEGVETIFGYPGGQVLPIYNALYDAKLEHIMPHHEQGGVHAADGYARSTGRVGVCLSTSGPGATNLVTGLATAYMDSVPIVAITGQVPSSMLGTDAFQEADITGITTPITKHNYLVQDIKDLARIIKEAFHIARTGRPGPVLIDIPKDIQNNKTKFIYPDQVNLPGYKTNYYGHELQIREVAKAINLAERPVLYAGGGVIISNASDELRNLAKRGNLPVTNTLTGLGSFDQRDILSLGMLGMHGTTEANLVISNADLIVAIGARFDDRVTGKLEEFAQKAKIVHIDIDPVEIGKRVAVDIPIVGDVKNILRGLNDLVEFKDREDWHKEIANWRKLGMIKRVKKSKKLSPKEIIEEIDDLTEGEALLTTEVGQHQMWAAQFYKYRKPRSFMTSGGLGTMGYGFPAAIGVQVGNKKDIVFALAGDGSFQMNSQELATVAKNRLPINIVIFNNGYLGMVRQWQEMFYDRRYSSVCLKEYNSCSSTCNKSNKDCSIISPDFVKLAEAYGIKAKRISRTEELRPALEEAINSPEAYLLDCIIEEEENVFPMVPPGGRLDKMVLEGDEQ